MHCAETFLHLFVAPQELISLMLQVNVEERYTAAQILNHPWVSVSKIFYYITHLDKNLKAQLILNTNRLT